MFRSIRWRLVVSYVLLTLLVVGLVGVLTLSLVERFVEQRVVKDLTANAETIARQAEPLLSPVRQTSALQELAQAAGFLGDVRVRILDDHQQVLADSGSPTGVDQFMLFTPPVEFGLEALDQSWIMVMPPDPSLGVPTQQGIPFLEQLPPDVQGTIVNRMADAWGNRFTFEGMSEEQLLPVPASDVGVESLQQTPEEEPAPRSEQAISVRIGEAEAPLGYVELSGSPDFGAEAMATTRRAFLFAAGGGILLAIIIGLLVSQGLTASLRALAATASRMSVDLSTRAPVRGSDEIGQLARQFNRMAERLEASFAALTADRDTLRRFIADASHELRTPITALKNFQELLRGEAADDPAAREEFLAESAAQVERLEWVTKNLLDLSRLDAGLIDLDLERQDVGELIHAANSAFRTLARDKEILFVINPPDYPLMFICDRARIQLALSNLLSNALKFTPRGGRVELGAEAVGDSVRFWVQDNGPGIDPVDRPHIFERFYRGRGSRSEGSGLGLAIVQSVVQAHGGRVWVESKPEKGSCFVIQVPRDFVRQGRRSPL